MLKYNKLTKIIDAILTADIISGSIIYNNYLYCAINNYGDMYVYNMLTNCCGTFAFFTQFSPQISTHHSIVIVRKVIWKTRETPFLFPDVAASGLKFGGMSIPTFRIQYTIFSRCDFSSLDACEAFVACLKHFCAGS